MVHDIAAEIERAKAEFLHADIFELIKERLSFRLHSLTYQLKPPRSAHLKLLRTCEDEVHARKLFGPKAEVALSVGLAVKAFFFANAVARTIDKLIPGIGQIPFG